MNTLDPIAAISALRAQLWDAGFPPVALVIGDKMPRIQNWQERARRAPPADAEEPPRRDHLNTGILCDGLRVIDIDIDDAALVARVKALGLQMLGGEPLIRTRPNSPRCALLYLAAEGHPRKLVAAVTGGKVEALGYGQQLHAFGRHPSGVDLQWHPEPPGQVMRDSLPAVTEDRLRAFLTAVAPIIGAPIPGDARGGSTGRKSGGNARTDDATADPLDIMAALAEIPNNAAADWEGWNSVGMAVWAATDGAEAGFIGWDGWSRRHAAYDAQATRARWDHYRTSPPNETGAGKLFKLAREARLGGCPPVNGGLTTMQTAMRLRT